MFVGSALTNFGVRMLLDAMVDLAPPPTPRADIDGVPRPLDAPFSAFVFKVQANMDPSHRDRLAFARICSGRFERGMVVTCDRSGRAVATKYATTVFGPDRETVEEAFPGDVVGLVNATGLQLGDTIYDGDAPVTFPPIPRFSPEVFATARPLDTGRAKQFRRGLEQLDEEGVVQVLRDPDLGTRRRCWPPSAPCSSRCSATGWPASSTPRPRSSAPRYQAIRRTDPRRSPRCGRSAGSASSSGPTVPSWPCSRTATACPPRGRRARADARAPRRRRHPRRLTRRTAAALCGSRCDYSHQSRTLLADAQFPRTLAAQCGSGATRPGRGLVADKSRRTSGDADLAGVVGGVGQRVPELGAHAGGARRAGGR